MINAYLSLKDFDKFVNDRLYALALNKPEGWEVRINELKLFRLMIKDKVNEGGKNEQSF